MALKVIRWCSTKLIRVYKQTVNSFQYLEVSTTVCSHQGGTIPVLWPSKITSTRRMEDAFADIWNHSTFKLTKPQRKKVYRQDKQRVKA